MIAASSIQGLRDPDMKIVDRQWIDFGQNPADGVADADSYVLFWLEDRPVGHVVVRKGDMIVRPPFRPA
jgi:hypothetical protein